MRTKSDDLAILLSVVEAGGFSAAAKICNIQVARVSRAVTKLEKQLGVTILNRTTRRFELTDEGREFVAAIRIGVMQLQQAEKNIILRSKLPKGHLCVDAASPFIFHQLVPLIQPFSQAYPDIELVLTSNESIVDLLEKKTDIAIRIGPLNESTLHARLLGRSALYIVASPNYLARRGTPTTTAVLIQHDILCFSKLKALNNWPLKGFVPLTLAISASNGETLRLLALMGNGIACLSNFMVKNDIDRGTLIPLLESEKISHLNLEQINAVYY